MISIEDILKQKETIVYSIHPDKTVYDAIQILNKKHVGCLMVLDKDQNIKGIVSERDILYKCGAEGHDPLNTQVKEIMTPKEKIIIGNKHDNIQYAMNMMTNNRIRHLPIIDVGEIIGIVSIGDIVKAHLKESEHEMKMLEDYISGG